MNWGSVVPVLTFQEKNVPEAHDPYKNNQFLDTRGLTAPAKGNQARDIPLRVAELSQPFGTKIEVNGDMAGVKVSGGK